MAPFQQTVTRILVNLSIYRSKVRIKANIRIVKHAFSRKTSIKLDLRSVLEAEVKADPEARTEASRGSLSKLVMETSCVADARSIMHLSALTVSP